MNGLASLISQWPVSYLTIISFSWFSLGITPPLFFSASLCSQNFWENGLFPWISHGVLTNVALFPHEMYQNHSVYFSTLASTRRRMGESSWTFGIRKSGALGFFSRSVWGFSWALECLSSVSPVQTPRHWRELWAQRGSAPVSDCPKDSRSFRAQGTVCGEQERGSVIPSSLNSPWRDYKDMKALPLSSLAKGREFVGSGRAPPPHKQPRPCTGSDPLCSPFHCKNGSWVLV